MKFKRMPIEIEAPEQMGYHHIKNNLAESSVTDTSFKSLNLNLDDLVLYYGDHLGKPELRSLLSAQYLLHAKDVLITASAAAALFIIHTSLLEKGDEIVVIHPNYGTNLETPRAIGVKLNTISLSFEDGFKLDMAMLRAKVNKNTRLISITYPHNPTGVILSENELKEVIAIAEYHNCYLLVDETYREMAFTKLPPLAATLSPLVISVSSVSKAYGLPGIRIGWVITQNKELQELFLAAKEQIFICNSVVDEEIAYQYLLNKEKNFLPIQQRIQDNFSYLKQWMNSQIYLEWVEPKGGVVCFPRLKSEFSVDMNLFYKKLFDDHKTIVGPGHWFEMDDRSMRIGFGWPSNMELRNGLKAIEDTFNFILS